MKLVIDTEYRENYSDSDTPRWKQKFGSTYVFNNIQLDGECKVVGIDDMISMVEIKNPAAEEIVSTWEVMSDDESIGVEHYELPSVIYYELVDGQWTGYKVNDTRVAETWLRGGIVVMEEFWDVNSDGSRKNYKQNFTMDDGSVLHSQDELSEWYSKVYTKQVVPDALVR